MPKRIVNSKHYKNARKNTKLFSEFLYSNSAGSANASEPSSSETDCFIEAFPNCNLISVQPNYVDDNNLCNLGAEK